MSKKNMWSQSSAIVFEICAEHVIKRNLRFPSKTLFIRDEKSKKTDITTNKDFLSAKQTN